MISKKIFQCRLCNSKKLQNILDLGNQPPANSLRKNLSETLENVPLSICRCAKCTTVQLNETIEPEYLFSNYLWVTGTSKSAREYSKKFAQGILSKFVNPINLFVVEVASNDGTFLKCFKELEHKTLGVDPAKNLVSEANKNGIKTLPEFFNSKVSKQIIKENGYADIVFARNVIPHVPDPNDVVSGMSNLLSSEGVGAIEFHSVDKIVKELHYDSIYHEHFFYHSLHTISNLLDLHNLHLFDVSESPISGGSLVAYFSKNIRDKTDSLYQKLKWEIDHGLNSIEVWHKFAKQSIEHGKKLKLLIESEISHNRKLIGYGASARSSTLLNFCNINNNHLSCIADQNELKHGTYTPGTDILIISPEEALKKKPDTIVILAWNFKDEIVKDLKQRGFSGKVILPLPHETYWVNI